MIWTLSGMIGAGFGSFVIMEGIKMTTGTFENAPGFMAFEALDAGRYWLLIIWLPYWILNIFGEEFLWRGVLLPRQEKRFGKSAWLIHGVVVVVSYRFWLAIMVIPFAAHVYPPLCCTENPKLLGGCDHTRRPQRPGVFGDGVWSFVADLES